MNRNAKKTLTALLLILFMFASGSCMPISKQHTNTDYLPPSSSDTATSQTEQNLSSDASSEAESEPPASSEVSSSISTHKPNKGNQVIIDTGEDVGAMDDPEDPMKPNDNKDEPEAPKDTIVIPDNNTGSSSSFNGSGSGANSSNTTTSASSSPVSSKPPVSSRPSSGLSSILSSSASSAVSSLISSLIPSSSVASSKPVFAPPNTGWYDYEGDRYLYQNGKPVSGYQSVNGFGRYFEQNGKLASKVGIDVSKFQSGGTINGVAQPVNWSKVKAAGVEFAIIRVGYRGWGSEGNLQKDPKFLENITNATSVGMNCGIYFFTQAKTEAEAIEEARTAVKWLEDSGKKITYPIFFDTESSTEGTGNGRADKLTVAQRTATAKAFCEEIKRLGYYPGIYASTSWFSSHLDMSNLKDYDVWTAHYRSDITPGPGYTKNMGMWQYTSKGSVNGIAGNVDCNIGLKDYPTFLKQNGYNKLSETEVATSSAVASSAAGSSEAVSSAK